MKTLEEIKEEYAVYCGYEFWIDLIIQSSNYTCDKHIDQIAKLYAKEVAKQALINASDHLDPDNFDNVHYYSKKRKKILNESNIPNL